QELEVLAAVGGAESAGVEHVHGVARHRVGEDVRVVPSALPEAVVGIHARPGVATILGAEDTALLGLDGRVHAVGGSARGRRGDATERPPGLAGALDLLPGEPTVRRAVQARAGAAAGEAPRLAPPLPEGCKQLVRILRIEHHVDATAVAVAEQHALPGLAAV